VSMAEERAKALGYSTLVLSTLVEGEAREVAKVMAGIAKEVRPPGVVFSRATQAVVAVQTRRGASEIVLVRIGVGLI
jgi:glycerate-2-kinase